MSAQVVYEDDIGYLCFKHAVHEATKGIKIKSTVPPNSETTAYLCHICVGGQRID